MELEDNYSLLQDNTIAVLRNYPRFLTLLKIFGNRFDELQYVVNYMCDETTLAKAKGVWLDYIGWLVGTKRDFSDINRFFCANAEDVNELKLFWFGNDADSTEGSLDDEPFRRRIYAKIGYNTSQCTRNENIYIIKNMTLADHCIIEVVEPMTLDITLYGDEIIETQNLREKIEDILGNGVGIRYLEIKGMDEWTNR